MDLRSLTLDEFLSRLGSADPVPGGGSLAAVAGAQAAAMLAMVCNLTVGRPRYADVETEVRAVLAETTQLQERLLQLAHRDMQAYLAVLDVYRLSRATDAERAARSAAIEGGMRGATEVPVETAEAARAVLALALRAARCTNASALGDVAVAAYLAMAAVRGAADQAQLNLGRLADRAFVTVMGTRIERAVEAVEAETTAIRETVFARSAER